MLNEEKNKLNIDSNELRQNEPEKKKEKDIPFWYENPNILFVQNYILEFFPTEEMTYNQKLNAITRTIILLFIIYFSFTKSFKSFIYTCITIFTIYLLYYYHNKDIQLKNSKKVNMELVESFVNPANDLLESNNIKTSDAVFTKPTTDNPFNNVLISDYDYNVNKKPAPPAFTNNNQKTITEIAKKTVQELNPDQANITDKLFNNLGNNLHFEQSLRQFNTTPNSTIPNDQGGFMDFCYGSMVSCKEGNQFACARNLARHTN
tara:strand:- start:3142 stop:3927 length:786 start_codon:yes stop_codon:yes gene_type:complete